MSTLWSLIPVLIDGASIVAFHLAVPALALRFGERSAGNAVLVGGVYLAVCAAAYVLRMLRPAGGSSAPAKTAGYTAAAGWFFGFFVLFLADQTSGFSASLMTSDGASSSILPALAAVGGIALALVFPLVLLRDPKRTIAAGTARYRISHALALIIVNTMVLLLLAFWRAYFETDTEPYEGLTMGAKILIFVFVYIFYLLFVSAPRLLLLSLDYRGLALASFLLSSAYFVWSSLSQSAW